jgi:hypothetical protein
LALLVGGCSLPPNPWLLAQVHARLAVPNPGRVPVNAAIPITFDQAVEPSLVHASLTPPVPVRISWRQGTMVISATGEWRPQTTYRVSIPGFKDSKRGLELKPWSAAFQTQPPLLASFSLDGRDVTSDRLAMPESSLSIRFPLSMNPATVQVRVDGQLPVPASMRWDSDRQTLTLPVSNFQPGLAVNVSVDAATSDRGDILTQSSAMQLTVAVIEPSNGSSGIPAGANPPTPIEIVVENSGPARPQAGLQAADMVVEYISEYSISRMTAIFFNAVPPLVGPVRSCRMINIPLSFGFRAVTMCSGASDGTLGRLQHQGVPVVINDYDRGGHFFRSHIRAAPHNLYTTGDRAERLRAEVKGITPALFMLDPPHDDSGLGTPAGAPGIPLQAVTYRYDAGRQVYLRFDHGAPFIDAATRAQVSVKTVAIVHAPFHDAGWVEDVNGGAHSIIYDLMGEGPAELYSDGRVINATWHMASGIPLYFTDANGQFIRLNTGLTWVHVVGNGQVR